MFRKRNSVNVAAMVSMNSNLCQRPLKLLPRCPKPITNSSNLCSCWPSKSQFSSPWAGSCSVRRQATPNSKLAFRNKKMTRAQRSEISKSKIIIMIILRRCKRKGPLRSRARGCASNPWRLRKPAMNHTSKLSRKLVDLLPNLRSTILLSRPWRSEECPQINSAYRPREIRRRATGQMRLKLKLISTSHR